MKTSQWAQLDESVKTALRGHPRLKRFIACVPLDLADGRTGEWKTARQRWDEHVQKWSAWAGDLDMAVEFVWQGSHELLRELSKPLNASLLQFFFGTRYLDDDWFRARLLEAHQAAGPRYTPKLNVKLRITEQFQAFGRTREFFDDIRSDARRIRHQLRNQVFALTKKPDVALQSKISAAGLACEQALEEFKRLSDDPVSQDPLANLRAALGSADKCIADLLTEYRAQRANAQAEREKVGDSTTPDADEIDRSQALRELQSDVGEALYSLNRCQSLVSSRLLILTGDAGTGKTHLLCDLAKQRLEMGRPTVVLMGQRFLETGDPWVQALQQLDLANWSAKDFIGALEVVARRANSRVLLIIDAINEGAGRWLWPEHLAPFLERVKASPWIATVLSVRSSYAEDILPDAVVADACFLEHAGFENIEFDATRAFFEHFGIDFPSTPLLAPEFSNPLYLKTLCAGLQATGQTRLPRGFHGVVKAFEQYVEGVNSKVAKSIDYNVRRNLVSLALKQLAHRMVEDQRAWLAYDVAEGLVNVLLPGRDYSRSLFAQLLGEGLLIEEKTWSDTESQSVTVVQIGYERLSDYLCVESLLDRHLQTAEPSKVFGTGGPLDVDALLTTWSRPGFHEALHILVAERTGQELISLVPALAEAHFTPHVFLNSLIWRDPEAVTPQAMAYLLSLKASHTAEVIDTLVTLATIPGHPLNVVYTDTLLRQDNMATRDAWWTIGLNELWGRKSAVDRVIQWANQLWPRTELTDEAAEMSASIVAWLLPSSNRFLRDHATKALVRILTWRPAVIDRLIDRFSTVDDAYVAERVLAAAYGAAMRTTDSIGVTVVAHRTHAKVFADGRPRPHILLREYARGIIKRAEHLQGDHGRVSWTGVEPPYASDWPVIPSDADIDVVVPSWSSDAGKALSWAHKRIRSSVMDDDFGRYVIGTNSWTTNWLSIRLDEPQWLSFDTQVERAESMLTGEELEGWKLFRHIARSVSMERYGRRWAAGAAHGDVPEDDVPRPATKDELALAEVHKSLLVLLGEKASVLSPLMDALASESSMRSVPKFDLKLVQHYVVGRVFELGWTSDRFGQFDRQVNSSGRDAAKCERVGKKYQWIAYHEMLAYMADHYQYAAGPRSREIGETYQGSWQDNIRDIDPSNVMRPPARSEDSRPSPLAFWAPVVSEWHSERSPTSWARETGDVPHPVELLFSTDEPSRTEWVSLHTDLKWAMPKPAYEDAFRDGRREVWIHADAALVQPQEVSKLQEVAGRIARGGVHGGGLYEIFLGEIGWSEASTFFNDPYYSHLGWAGEVDHEGLTPIPASQGYLRERGGFDCSVTPETISLRVPTDALLKLLGAQWSGISATYVDGVGAVVAFDPSANIAGPSALLVRRDKLRAALQEQDLVVCWMVQGEKTDAAGAPNYRAQARRSFHGVFIWDGETMTGDYVFDALESHEEDSD